MNCAPEASGVGTGMDDVVRVRAPGCLSPL